MRNAYWDLAYAIASLQVQQQSLDLARENLRNTRARIEIGTTPPIEEIEPEAEVAQREEAVITAESRIATAEDTPARPDLQSQRSRLLDDPHRADRPAAVSAERRRHRQAPCAMRSIAGAICSRAGRRSSRATSRSATCATRRLPEVNADIDYSVSGVGGTQLIRSSVIGGDVIGQIAARLRIGDRRSVHEQLSHVDGEPDIRYPLGRSPQEANLARARLQYSQTQTQIRQQQLQVTTQVRDAARQVTTNQKRVETTRRAREFAERRLDAEQRKLAAGTQTNYFVLQAQRDLAQARNTELNVILDYQRSLIDFETVQEIPLAGGGAVAAVAGGGAAFAGGASGGAASGGAASAR